MMSHTAVQSALTSLREQFVRAASEGPEQARWVVLCVPAPAKGAETLLDLSATEETVYFSSGPVSFDQASSSREPEALPQATFVGVGSVASGRFEGRERFDAAKRFIHDTLKRAFIPPHLVDLVRFYGGAAFSPGRDGRGSSWSEFGDARFFLPRCTYIDGADATDVQVGELPLEQSLLIAIADRHDPEPTLGLAATLLEALSLKRDEDYEPFAPPRALCRTESEVPAKWKRLVYDIQHSIYKGEVKKVVAARRVTLRLSRPPRASVILERFRSQAPLCTRFALRIGAKTFIGATPERLIEKRGREICTEALAGSISTNETDAAATLLGSQKNLKEHALVVEAIEQALRPVCRTLAIAPEPTVRSLRTILHLRTLIVGELDRDHHVLSLVERLHPTPAVGGLPCERAVEFIAQHEQAERGWYAAPLGWVNAAGDGEFVVALRSGLIVGDKVHLYAGAGIVADSDPTEEYDETELKLSGMLGALGLGPLDDVPVASQVEEQGLVETRSPERAVAEAHGRLSP